MWSAFGDGEPVRVVECDSEEHEAERAVARLLALRAGAAQGPVTVRRCNPDQCCALAAGLPAFGGAGDGGAPQARPS